jgi:hypothetical protein
LKPALRCPFTPDAACVHRIPPRVRDDRDTPLLWDETAVDIGVIWLREEQESFCNGDWTTQITLVCLNNFAFCEIADSARAAPDEQSGIQVSCCLRSRGVCFLP